MEKAGILPETKASYDSGTGNMNWIRNNVLFVLRILG